MDRGPDVLVQVVFFLLYRQLCNDVDGFQLNFLVNPAPILGCPSFPLVSRNVQKLLTILYFDFYLWFGTGAVDLLILVASQLPNP